MTNPITANKDILGYLLKERIGSGGFGEVWSAVAPGGIMKAVKVVYGFHNEKHAQAELKALDRVKGLRHPFLLSLERIEIHEGQLVVVTELADKSLADNFNEYIIQGEIGIPRDVLIKYMRNTAEALDYMSSEHQLQHLDIKPENLLVVGGHVKVADFGLAKNLNSTNQSLMSGMTPTYAAPELFDGRPGANSDQYSLAIVYQEMLTGVKPFPGTTPAQLAAQHMHGKPNLRPLDKHDQVVIAKALNKDPANRFSNCLEMVEELAHKKRTTKKAIRRTQVVREHADTESPTACFPANTSGTAIISQSALPFQASESKVLDAPDCDPANATIRPTLIVGVGSTANRVVQKIKSRLANRNGSMDLLPSVQLLCIDTDRQDLSDLQREEGFGALAQNEILETPLRKPETYRSRNREHLKWLSRRWIYNVPRSLQTEGLRPLGRLAFADHFERICDRIQSSLDEIVKEENLAVTSDSLGMNPGTTNPRVFLISSISGGIGSGMSIDLAYTIKLLLHESGLPSECLTGLFMHSTYQRNRDPGLSSANAFAFLTELRHFSEHGNPGDDTIGLPEFGDELPFDYTYFNDLGNDLPQSVFEEKLDRVAEYVSLSSLSKSSEFFDQCRALEEEIDHLALRTFGISVTAPEPRDSGESLSNQVVHSVFNKWLKGDESTEFDATVEAEQILEQLQLDIDQVTEQISIEAEAVFENSFEQTAAQLVEVCQSEPTDHGQHLSSFLDGVLGYKGAEESPDSVLQMEERIHQCSTESSQSLTESILGMMNGQSMRLHECRETNQSVLNKLKNIQEQVRHRIFECERHVEDFENQLSRLEPESNAPQHVKDEFKQALIEYCRHRFQLFATNFISMYFTSNVTSVENIQIQLKQHHDLLNTISLKIPLSEEMDSSLVDERLNISSLMKSSINAKLSELTAKTELQVYETLVKESGGYNQLLGEIATVQDNLGYALSLAARRVVTAATRQINLDNIIVENGLAPEQLANWFNRKIKDAQPQVRECGGSARIMIGIPANEATSFIPDALAKQFGISGFNFYETEGNFILCFEGEDVPVANVAYRLLEERPDAIELVKRIHVRNDIDWTSLHDLL